MTHATLSTEPLPATDPAADTAAAAERAAAEAEVEVEQDLDVESDSETGQDSEAEPDSAATASDLQLAGGTLNDEELAAVTAVLGTLAGASEVAHNGAGTAGPSDRTLQRRRRLGLWGRPGPDSWKNAAGLR